MFTVNIKVLFVLTDKHNQKRMYIGFLYLNPEDIKN